MLRRFPDHSWYRQDDDSPWRGQLRGNWCWSPPWYSSLQPCRWRWHWDWTLPPHYCWRNHQNTSRWTTTTPAISSFYLTLLPLYIYTKKWKDIKKKRLIVMLEKNLDDISWDIRWRQVYSLVLSALSQLWIRKAKQIITTIQPFILFFQWNMMLMICIIIIW